MQTQESKVASEAITPPPASKPTGPRLVIRVKISPDPPPEPARRSINARMVACAVVVIGMLTLIVMGVSTFEDESAATRLVNAEAEKPEPPSSMPAPGTSGRTARENDVQPSTPGPSTQEIAPAGVSSVTQSSVEAASDTSSLERTESPLSPTHEVIPEAPRSALQTITGTIRVVIRVDIDKTGAVVATTSEVPGPSRYFERLAREAAMKWTFTPSSTSAPRVMWLRFYFKRQGVTAEATPPDE